MSYESKRKSIAQEKSYAFAIKIVKLYQHMISEKKEYVLSKQVLRSGTSIGANIEEALGAQSSKDFANKISVAYKEARETRYWIRLLHDSDILEEKRAVPALADVEELIKIIGSIQKTMYEKINS